ncbi:ABC transporter permease [Streptomyces violaceorubidus]|uniref:ABC transporter permease n=1 Tax=Streptomyces violaceorubidus TaxID=284042 RepID=UPI0004C0D94F|nr:ABC transporter permease [Streptomyces violaceorubidus]
MTAVLRVARESSQLARRNLLRLVRTPTSLVSSLLEPVMFALLIGFVFGNSLGGGIYREYIVAGLLAQTVVFTTSFTTIGLSRDLEEGAVDRFRALPISRVSILLARTCSDMIVCVASVCVTTLSGLALGWRAHTGVLHTAAGFLLLLLFAFAMSWVGAFIGVIAPTVQVALSLGFIWMFPAAYISSGYVAARSLPGPLAHIAEWSPITALVNALRQQFGNPVPRQFPVPRGWPVEHAVPYLLLWSAVLLTVFVSWATYAYRNKSKSR